MVAFAQPAHLVPRPSRNTRANGTSLTRRCVPRAVAARDERAAPSSIDELVLSWFSSGTRPGRKGGKKQRDETLSEPISGPTSASTGAAHYLLSTTIIARSDKAREMAELLKELKEAADKCIPEEGPLVCAVNQSPDDHAVFIVFERFSGSDVMTAYQKGPVYQKFIRGCQPLLERPFGVHICKEIDGKVSLAYHPFGPAGMFSISSLLSKIELVLAACQFIVSFSLS